MTPYGDSHGYRGGPLPFSSQMLDKVCGRRGRGCWLRRGVDERSYKSDVTVRRWLPHFEAHARGVVIPAATCEKGRAWPRSTSRLLQWKGMRLP